MVGSTRRRSDATQNPLGSLDSRVRFKLWKENHVPLLYDWISSRNLVWPHAAVQWGALNTDEGAQQRAAPKPYTTRAIYLAERTGKSSRDPNTLLHFDVKVNQQLTCKPQDVAKPWMDDGGVGERVDQMSTRDFSLKSRIIHPGEVNRIRLIAPDVVVTHTDEKELYIWDFKRQPNRGVNDTEKNVPDIVLKGHTEVADYAVDVANTKSEQVTPEDTWVVSGGRDRNVLLWRLKDYETHGRNMDAFTTMEGSGRAHSGRGHTATVEDVSFNGSDRNLIASVGQDAAILFWDARSPSAPSERVEKAHDGDVNGCDYSGPMEHLVVTAGNDHLVKVWDRRFLKDANGIAKPTHVLTGHSDQVLNVLWNKNVPGVCASGGEDGHVLIWKVDASTETRLAPEKHYGKSQELMFRHVGHGLNQTKLVDFQWLPSEADPWCIASLSETCAEGGSVLQIWRMSDMLYRPHEEVAADLRMFGRETL